jgi:hypothetical protein
VGPEFDSHWRSEVKPAAAFADVGCVLLGRLKAAIKLEHHRTQLADMQQSIENAVESAPYLVQCCGWNIFELDPRSVCRVGDGKSLSDVGRKGIVRPALVREEARGFDVENESVWRCFCPLRDSLVGWQRVGACINLHSTPLLAVNRKLVGSGLATPWVEACFRDAWVRPPASARDDPTGGAIHVDTTEYAGVNKMQRREDTAGVAIGEAKANA